MMLGDSPRLCLRYPIYEDLFSFVVCAQPEFRFFDVRGSSCAAPLRSVCHASKPVPVVSYTIALYRLLEQASWPSEFDILFFP
jgi:hypothetical protein